MENDLWRKLIIKNSFSFQESDLHVPVQLQWGVEPA